MARKPNYNFERSERERLKALKVAEKAEAKRRAREEGRPESDDASTPAEDEED